MHFLWMKMCSLGIPFPMSPNSGFWQLSAYDCSFTNKHCFFYQSWTPTSRSQENCLCCVQISHLALMASNRNSICDIWSHKTINSDREIVNSIPPLCISFSDVNLISYPISLTSPVHVLYVQYSFLYFFFGVKLISSPIWPLTCRQKAQLGGNFANACNQRQSVEDSFLRDGNENLKTSATVQNFLIEKGTGF